MSFERIEKGYIIFDMMNQLGLGEHFENVMYPPTYNALPNDCKLIILEASLEEAVRMVNHERMMAWLKEIMAAREKAAETPAPVSDRDTMKTSNDRGWTKLPPSSTDTATPRVTLPSLDEEAPKFKRGDRVRIVSETWNGFKTGTVTGFSAHESQTVLVNDRGINGTGPPYCFAESELELVPAAAPAPEQRKFQVGDTIQMTGAHSSRSPLMVVVGINGDYIVVEAKDGSGSRFRANPNLYELIAKAPAPDDGAFASDAEDRELVAMGREIWDKWAYDVADRGECPVGSIDVSMIKFCSNPNDELGETWRVLYDSSVVPRLTPANRALLRRVARERKAEKGSET